MNSFFEMDWNAKWDWEHLAMFSSKACASPRRTLDSNWGAEEEIDARSFNLSGESGGSGSEVGHPSSSSAKSSVSAPIHSSLKEEGVKTSDFVFEPFDGDFDVKKEPIRDGLAGSSSPVEASVGSGEPAIGLKLGKRTYFEDSCAASNSKTSIPVSSASAAKRTKSSCQSAPPVARCQVGGCNLDLSSAKDYHRKHRVCEHHSKSPNVIIGGLERRFCQQCSRFHSLSEFDEKKRSCRRRLSDHNARRRKPQQETFQFHSPRLSSSFYGGGQQINFLLNNAPVPQSKPSANFPWDTCGSKFTLTNGCSLKPGKAGVINRHSTVVEFRDPHPSNLHDSIKPVSCKGTTADISNQGFKDSLCSPNSDAALEFRRALSLLSSTSWESSEPELITLDDHMDLSRTVMPLHVTAGAVPQELPLAPSDYCQTGPQNHRGIHSVSVNSNTIGHFQEIQHLGPPDETLYYNNPLD